MIARRWLPGVLLLVLAPVPTRGEDQGAKVPDSSVTRDDTKEKVRFKIRVLAEGDDGFGDTRATPFYKTIYRKSSDEAETALKEGRPRLFSYGMLGISDLDPETGLAVERIAGCCVDAEVLGRAEGTNDRVRAWFKEHGPTPNSLLRWKDELTDLPAFFAARTKARATISLRIGGPTLKSPDGRFSLRQVAVQVKRGILPNRWTVTTIGLEVSERGVVREVLADYFGDGLTDLAWGPPGAPFAVVKHLRDEGPDFYILHLRPVDWVTNGQLSWQRYRKDHPE
jgi:hypothetical protein